MTTVYPRRLILVLLGSTNRFGEGAGLCGAAGSFTTNGPPADVLADSKRML
jgi:hypothetical protein